MFFRKNLCYIGPVLGLLLMSLLVINFTTQQDMYKQTMDYEVQMADGFYYTNTEIQEWVDSVRSQAGIYQREIEQFTYLLICAGDQGEKGYALTLVDTIQSEQEIRVVYSLIKTQENEISEGQTTPFMLVRVPSHSYLKLGGKQISEEEIPSYLEEKQDQIK